MAKSKKEIKQDLSDDAKISAVKSLIKNPNNKLDKRQLKQLLKTYGPYAHDIIVMAQKEPKDLMARVGKKEEFLTRKAIEYFATNKVSTDTLAKALKTDKKDIEKTLEKAPPKKSAQKASAEQSQDKFSKRVDAKTAQKSKTMTSADKQLRDIKSWAKSIGLNPEDTAARLVKKYGTLAYDVMEKSMHTPSAVMRNMGEKPLGSSEKVVEYFLNQNIDTAKLSKALNIKESEIKKKVPSQKTANFDARVEQRASQNSAKQNTTAQNNTQEPKGRKVSEFSVTMSSSPAKNYTDLANQAYKNFSAIEEKRNDIYLDCFGHPTTGVGHLIFNVNDINDKEQMQKWKERFLATCDYPNMTKKQQEKVFDTLAAQLKKAKQYQKAHGCDLDKALSKTTLGAQKVKGAGWNLTAPAIAKAKLTEKGVQNTFNCDFKEWYDKVKKAVPNIDRYPLPVQLSTIHTAFAGQYKVLTSPKCKSLKGLVEVVSKARNPLNVPVCEGDTVNAARKCVNLPTLSSRSSVLAQRQRARQSGTARA